mgnify:CR=1 FL=1|jgi:hypothetical protein
MEIKTEATYIELHTHNPTDNEYIIRVIPQYVTVITNEYNLRDNNGITNKYSSNS